MKDGEGACSRGGRPSGAADVVFDLVGMGTTVDVYFVDAIHSQELEGVFDERGVGEWEKTLGK